MDGQSFTKEHFIEAIKKLTAYVKRIDNQNTTYRNTTAKDLQIALKNVQNTSSSEFNTLKGNITAKTDKQLLKLKNDMDILKGIIDERLSSITNGKDADNDLILKGLLDSIKIPTIEELKNDLPVMGKEVRDALELLKGKERLEVSAINGLDEKLTEIESSAKRMPMGGGGPNANAVQYADLSSQVDGVTKTFTVPRHRKILMLQSTSFPLLYRPTVDFTTANLILTMTDEVDILPSGQSLIFLYVK